MNISKLLKRSRIAIHVLGSYGLFSTFRDYILFLRCLLFTGSTETPELINVKKYEHPLACRPGTADAAMLWHTLADEMHITEMNLRENAVIFDLGANVGYTVIDFAIKFPTATIVAVELDKENAVIARHNIAPFSERCTLIEGAVWNEDGEIDYGGGGAESLRVNASPRFVADRTASSFTIDTLMRMNGIEYIDFLKMDIEGAESQVLDSNAEWMQKVDTINVEAHFDHISTEECQQRLENAGFDVTIGKNDPKWLWGQRQIDLVRKSV